MNPRYLTPWSMMQAVRQSAALIRIGSHIRIAGFANPKEGVSHIDAVATNSAQCSGKGKIAHGVLIGRPDDKPAIQTGTEVTP